MGISGWASGLLTGLIIGMAFGLRAGAVLAARNARRRSARAFAVSAHRPPGDGRQEPEGLADAAAGTKPARPGEVPVLPPVIDYAPIFSDADAPPSPADVAEGPKETP